MHGPSNRVFEERTAAFGSQLVDVVAAVCSGCGWDSVLFMSCLERFPRVFSFLGVGFLSAAISRHVVPSNRFFDRHLRERVNFFYASSILCARSVLDSITRLDATRLIPE